MELTLKVCWQKKHKKGRLSLLPDDPFLCIKIYLINSDPLLTG